MKDKMLVKAVIAVASGVCAYKAITTYKHHKLQKELYSNNEQYEQRDEE